MTREQIKSVLVGALVLALCVLFLTRYAYYGNDRGLMYKVDRWTGRIWFITPQGITPVPRTSSLADLTRD